MKQLLILALLVILLQGFNLQRRKKGEHKVRNDITFPVRAAYIDRMLSWYGMSVATGLGIPGYATHDYNFIIFAFWSCNSGPLDVSLVWQNLSLYLGQNNPYGKTNEEVQIGARKAYNDGGVKVLVSAFGATEFPTTYYEDPAACGKALAEFVNINHLDGADIDWEDNAAMEAGTG